MSMLGVIARTHNYKNISQTQMPPRGGQARTHVGAFGDNASNFFVTPRIFLFSEKYVLNIQ